MEDRYLQQKRFQMLGTEGQRKLQEANVTIIGCGALGSVAADILARAGIGTIILVDRDYVEFSNLHRQTLYTEQDAIDMIPKVEAAKRRLYQVNHHVTVEAIFDHADAQMVEQFAERSDIIVDGTDNFETRLIINDACLKYQIPWIYGACVGSTSVVKSFHGDSSVCFRCLLPVLPAMNETCATSGVIAPAVYMTAAFQCAEVFKYLSGDIDHMHKELVWIDVWTNQHHKFGIEKIKRINCPSCGEKRTYPSLKRINQTKSTSFCGCSTAQIIPATGRTLTLDDGENVANSQNLLFKRTPYFVQIDYKGCRLMLFANGRLLFHGIQDVNEANSLYHQLFG
ncbi:ThiF family adenylyltransferase [Peribacillus loiseleuriae]|uniref:ThiF family adenylyltransferase n=1 Tax=Peribacillus loiseleuriae TaxID=1679170 RepID=UPI0037FA0301